MRVAGEDAAYGLTKLRHTAGTIWLAGPAGAMDGEVRILVRAIDVTLSPRPPQQLSVRSTLAGTIVGMEIEGPLAAVEIDLDGEGRLFAMATRRAIDDLGFAAGDRVFALIKTVALDESTVGAVRT